MSSGAKAGRISRPLESISGWTSELVIVLKFLERKEGMWEHPIMTVKADSKKRVVVPGAAPGDVFAFEDMGNGHFVLVRLSRPAPPAKKLPREVRAAITASRMRPTMGWDELRKLTREQ